ncbi:hypothetical protein ACH5RR_036623 [Cinchona calisaya]|uniref:Uncharacterized protein n=1 Tax=Cinchona calisaya TaxID=153742 RepID=A0ABD2Y8A8_9GENT
MKEHSDISGAATNVTIEVSDSNSCRQLVYNKRQKLDNNVSSSSFKGVVLQQNGHWGAQIYANHERIWLGTFKSEMEAAMAYDSAAIKVRGGDSYRNFPWTNITVEEPNFQTQFSKEAVLNMIRDGSYPSKFVDYLRAQPKVEHNLAIVTRNGGFFCKKLFHKELTPSDVGKLNRLVIPKKFAMMHFPHISDAVHDNEDGAGVDDTELVFFDRSMRSWKFRFCYWKSSQSFVFTRGWNSFVREKGLRAKDLVIFSISECKDSSDELQSMFMIDVGYHEGFNSGLVLKASEEERDFPGTESNDSAKKGLRLFGVQII